MDFLYYTGDAKMEIPPAINLIMSWNDVKRTRICTEALENEVKAMRQELVDIRKALQAVHTLLAECRDVYIYGPSSDNATKTAASFKKLQSGILLSE